MKKSHFLSLLAGLVLMFGGPAVGLFLTVQRMMQAVAAQGDQPAVTERPAADLTRALAPTHAGLAVGAAGLGLVLVAVALIFRERKARTNTPPPTVPPFRSPI